MEDVVIAPRAVPLGGLRGIEVHRTLPHRRRSSIGAWCFLDHFGPTLDAMEVLPHPHIGLQTVTWPFEGQIRHRDSLGSDVLLRPGELNLMTSGNGISHSEFSVDPGSLMHGVQLWAALPGRSRFVDPDFEHISDPPKASGDGWEATVFVGEFDGEASHARTHSALVGAQLQIQSGVCTIPLRAGFEYGLLAVDGPVWAEGRLIRPRELQCFDPGRTQMAISADEPRMAMLIGGEPFKDELVMWWNFIGRSHEEIVDAREDWQAASVRFGHVDGHGGRVIPAPPIPPVRLSPRRRR